MARCVVCAERAEIKPGLSRRVLRQPAESPAQGLLRLVLWEARGWLRESLVQAIEAELAPRPPEPLIVRKIVCRTCGQREQTIRDEGPALKMWIDEPLCPRPPRPEPRPRARATSLTVRVKRGAASPGGADHQQRMVGTRTATTKGR